MSGTVLTNPQFAGPSLGVGNQLSPSVVNSYRISAVADRLAMHVKPGNHCDAVEFFNLCLSLSRGIDYALANNEIPSKAQDLPMLLKQICQRKSDLFLQAGIMVLMISVKHACKLGWFPRKESEELLIISDEIGKSFCSMWGVNAGPSYCQVTIPTIIGRFYPKMKVGPILASLEVKPGYGAFATDFHISKNTAHSPHDKIWLLVAQTDNLETSACLITPQQVSFLLNGKGVDRRTNVIMDPGPQMPTNVTGMLKYGTNLLQALGQFNGHYLIVVAFMSPTTLPENPVIPEYVQPAVTSLGSDSDIIEGPSQISLNCPISFTRIKIPVKGRTCKHFQCFDFSNYVDINSRRPSWRCPHCNQYIRYTDIRLDRNMVEVLKNVGDNVVEVVISADGSWKAVFKDDDNANKIQNDDHNFGKERTEPKESTGSPQAIPDVLDLTNDDDMETLNTWEAEDRKPLLADLHSQSINPSLTSLGMNSAGVNQNVAAQEEDEFWSRACLAGRLDNRIVVGTSEHPILTDAISPAINQEAEGHGNPLTSNSVMQNQLSAPNNFHLQQSNFLNSTSNDYGRSQTVPRHINRTPVAIQALPAQSQALGPQQRSRTNLNPLLPNSSSTGTAYVPLSSPANAFNAILSDTERQQHFSRPTMNPPQVLGVTSSALQHHSATQSQAPPPSAVTSAPSQLPYSTPGFLTEFRNPHLQQALNQRTTQPISQSSSDVRSHVQQNGSQSGVGRAAGASVTSQPSRVMAAGQVGRQSLSVPVQNQTSRAASSFSSDIFRGLAGEQSGNVGGSAQSMSRPDGSFNLQSEPNWQPTGRMRGSLSGRPYSNDVQRLIIEPTQSVQSARPQGSQPALPSIASRFHPR